MKETSQNINSSNGSNSSSCTPSPIQQVQLQIQQSTNQQQQQIVSKGHGGGRSHTIMSPEEAASGKRSHWSELELTGNSKINHTYNHNYLCMIIIINDNLMFQVTSGI